MLMGPRLKRPLQRIGEGVVELVFPFQARLYRKYHTFTMAGKLKFIENLNLCEPALALDGDIVECGTWRGGISAAMAEVARDKAIARRSVLFDSFQGLPPPDVVDGAKASAWASDTASPDYYDNCTASEDDARRAMSLSGIESYRIFAGWFDETLSLYAAEHPKIAILRLDGDWYRSTMTCLEILYPRVVPGGVVIIDDYGTWEGCTRAVHDYLSRTQRVEPVRRTRITNVAFLMKQAD
jgi:O-methyltransferase